MRPRSSQSGRIPMVLIGSLLVYLVKTLKHWNGAERATRLHAAVHASLGIMEPSTTTLKRSLWLISVYNPPDKLPIIPCSAILGPDWRVESDFIFNFLNCEFLSD